MNYTKMQYKIILISLFTSVLAAPIVKSRATSHSNQLTIAFSTNPGPQQFQNVAFTSSNEYSITGGQPWGGVSTSYGEDIQGAGSMVITVEAGRHDSTAPAQFFLANANGFFGANSFSSAPSELNFAFTGVLTIDGSSYDIVIGQGSNSEGNDWWIGGQGWTLTTSVQLTSPDGKYSFNIGFGQTKANDDSFSLSMN
jgi:hypothetical protein